MRRKIMALMVCASTHGQAVELVVSAHQADPASSTGFTVFFGVFGTSGPFNELDHQVDYRTSLGEGSLMFDAGQRAGIDVAITSGVEILNPEDFERVTNGASSGIDVSPNAPIQNFVVPNNTSVNWQVIRTQLIQQSEYDSARFHYQMDGLVNRRQGWQYRSAGDVQQLSLTPQTVVPMSVNLSQEQVGDEWRARLDGVVGYHYALGQWDISVAGSIGQGGLDGVGSHWYSVGADAWLEARQQGPFFRVTQQFAREDAREVESVQLSNWQNQTLLSAIGWRGQTYINCFDLNASFGIENRKSHSSGQVSDGISTQNITDLPDETEGFVSLGLARRTAHSQWHSAVRHYSGRTEFVLNWGF